MLTTDTELTKHTDPDAKVKCEICGITCKNRHALSSHKWRLHTNRKRPTCDTCHQVFSNATNLRNHIKAVHSTKERPRFPCRFPNCDKTYLRKSDFTRHMKTEHAQNPRFPCTLCRQEFKSSSHLGRHISTQTTEKTFNCATCEKSFSEKCGKTRHEIRHLSKSARDVSNCHICPQTFLSRITLQRHIRIVHENERNYACTLCDKRCSNSGNLKRHVEARHATNKEKIYSCDKCKYRTHSKGYLAAHRRRHNAVRHKCYFCVKKFVAFQALARHCRVHTLEKSKYLSI